MSIKHAMRKRYAELYKKELLSSTNNAPGLSKKEWDEYDRIWCVFEDKGRTGLCPSEHFVRTYTKEWGGERGFAPPSTSCEHPSYGCIPV